jgi:hypothetical protein
MARIAAFADLAALADIFWAGTAGRAAVGAERRGWTGRKGNFKAIVLLLFPLLTFLTLLTLLNFWGYEGFWSRAG